MKKSILIFQLTLISIVSISAQKVGIGTSTPLTNLHVDLGASRSNGILFSGMEPTEGNFPSLGEGRRFMFYPGTGAIRAGYVDGIQWDKSQVGPFSSAFGYNTLARGFGSCAIGDATLAGGITSSAFGNYTIAKGYSSFVVGMYNDPVIPADEVVPTSNTPLFLVGNGDNNETRHNAIIVRKDGHVGIGTNEPANELSVEGSANFTGSAGIGIVSPDASAQLEVSSTTKGFLPPRMTFEQRGAIPNPVAGLVIWCSDCDELQVYNGTIWKKMDGRAASDISLPSVTICDQDWMIKNLDVNTYRNGDPIPKVTNNEEWTALTTGAYCYYMNDSATYATIYGKLYNWYAVNDSRGLSPEGWHVPTHPEWYTLSDCLGGSPIAGGKMKEAGLVHWNSPNEGATNNSGFTGLPGGYRNYFGEFFDLGSNSKLWSSTPIGVVENPIYSRILSYSTTDLVVHIAESKEGFSVRCVRN